MSFKRKINRFRGVLMHSLTKYVGRSSFDGESLRDSNIEVKRVLVSRPNSRLGNQLLITPLVQEVSNRFPGCKIDLFVRGNIAPILFENNENIDRIIRLPKKPFKELLKYLGVWMSLRKYHYDIVINGDQHSSSGRISTQIVNARYKFSSDIDEDLNARYKDYRHMAKFPIYNLRNDLEKLGMKTENTEIPLLDINLTDTEIKKGKELLDTIVSNDKKTICIYTFATADKCYPPSWWEPFYDRLKSEYAEKYNILEVLPAENVSQINFQALSYYSKDLREMAALIHNTEIFITGDCGVMHLASAAHTPTIGLFSVSNLERYEPYNKGSLGIDTNKTDTEGIIKEIDKILFANI
ncbi:glycosyltransferase family 9 protein [Dysgonomonas sp. Marseille-P4677]|uniref:glycosyltransferase family 9 protein n=1 Tax=Dysgonomonas sp. Marseille-P4677 TaxID=2364790 RepID=UPI0019134459|nr:glycosyltransferase family 9 protein [Dysgonomonas sp. Marseille-P4677]MBK5722458.1 glycosyltransferase family 9 protein [Dysgonomonas sp. Marseille-P4677]